MGDRSQKAMICKLFIRFGEDRSELLRTEHVVHELDVISRVDTLTWIKRANLCRLNPLLPVIVFIPDLPVNDRSVGHGIFVVKQVCIVVSPGPIIYDHSHHLKRCLHEHRYGYESPFIFLAWFH